VIGALCEHYHWPPDFWRQMGWRELRAWLRELNRSARRRREGSRTHPDSWAGKEGDPFWAQVAAKHRQMRGW